MADRSAIEWTDATWNPIRARAKHPRNLKNGTAIVDPVGWHCEHVSEGCRGCYAEALNLRLGTGLPFKPGHRRDIDLLVDDKLLLAPLRWKRPRMIFVCSMTDLFADFVPDAMIDRLFAVMALCAQHIFQVLTKRPERMRAYLGDPRRPHRIARAVLDLAIEHPALFDRTPWPVASIGDIDAPDDLTLHQWPLPNAWLGTSVEDQPAADARIPQLLATPAAKRFLSCEPLLGPVRIAWALGSRLDIAAGFLRRGQFSPGMETLRRLDWVIVGGESGRNARPMHPDWARALRDQCAAARVPFFFKQWGEWLPCRHLQKPSGEWAPEALDGSGRIFQYGADQGKSHIFMVDPSCRSLGDVATWRVGKKIAGRLLDGVQHDGMPA
jgi:protein gp37